MALEEFGSSIAESRELEGAYLPSDPMSPCLGWTERTFGRRQRISPWWWLVIGGVVVLLLRDNKKDNRGGAQ